jgi:hypothetical protein
MTLIALNKPVPSTQDAADGDAVGDSVGGGLVSSGLHALHVLGQTLRAGMPTPQRDFILR